jgi:hypothetical protein
MNQDIQINSSGSQNDPSSDKWFTTKMNGTESDKVRAYFKTHSPGELSGNFTQAEKDHLVMTIIDHLQKSGCRKYCLMTDDKIALNQLRISHLRMFTFQTNDTAYSDILQERQEKTKSQASQEMKLA